MIYLDSCLVIYLVEPDNPYMARIRETIEAQPDIELAVSPLVIMECLVGPLRSRSEVLRSRYLRFFDQTTVLSLDRPAFERAAELRADHGLKTPDALHLAAALTSGCTELWTNDRRLNRAAGDFAVKVVS